MLSIEDKIRCLKDSELFSGIPTDSLRKIAEVVQELRFPDEGVVFNDGEKGDSVYFVAEGEVKAHRAGIELIRVGKNGCIGEMGVIDEAPRCGSVSSIGNSLLLKLNRDDFYVATEGNTKLLQNVLKIVLGKLRKDTDRQIKAVRERERVMQDLVRAREMQMNMLPTSDLSISEGDSARLTATGYCYPAEKVGGDYYDYFSLPDAQVGLVIGDVMGHGFHTGLMVAMAKSCLQMQLKTDYSIPSVMTAMGDMVHGFVHGEQALFMTFCYMIVDLKKHTVSFSNAGHAYPYHYRATQKQLEELESNCCPLGILEFQDYEISQAEWERGDIIVLYTDGIVEARNKSGEDFGEEALKMLIAENAHLSPVELKEAVLNKLNSFCQDVIQADDVTLVTVNMV